MEKLELESQGMDMGETLPCCGAWARLVRACLHYQTVTVSSCVIRGLDRFTGWSPVTGGKWKEWIARDFSGGSVGNEGWGKETTRWRVTETQKNGKITKGMELFGWKRKEFTKRFTGKWAKAEHRGKPDEGGGYTDKIKRQTRKDE